MPTHPRKHEMQPPGNEEAKPLDNSDLRYQIEKRADEIWLSSGCNHGNGVAHWLQAETEMLAGRQKNPAL